MTYNTIRYEVADRVLTITLDRPEHRNTVTYETLDELIDAFDRAQDDDDVRVIVLTGAGRVLLGGHRSERRQRRTTTPTRRASSHCEAAHATWAASWRCACSRRTRP